VWRARFTVTDFTPRTIAISTDTGRFAIYPERSSAMSEQREVTEGQLEIAVIPAPGALGLLGLGGAVGLRRRRAACAAGALGALGGSALAQPGNAWVLEASGDLSSAQTWPCGVRSG
jgi:hypothetical protein